MSDFEDLFDEWLTQSVSIEPAQGGSMEGVTFGAAVPFADVAVEHARRLVRDADGREAVSETTIYIPAGRPAVKAGDRVTLGDGSIATVIRTADFSPFGLFDHKVANLT